MEERSGDGSRFFSETALANAFALSYSDHDYGCNNGDSTFEHGRESGMAFVDFLGLPEGSAMRRRAYRGHGVYGVKLFDFSRPAGQEEVPDAEARIDPDVVGAPGDSTLTYSATHSVAVFVLDVRTNKSPWSKDRSKTDYEGDFLGERQWWWFENAIRNSRAAVNVVVNGLQVHANIIGDPNIAEAWGKFPSAQQRLYDALLQDGVESPVLISGDVHMTELSRKDCIPANGLAIETPRPLVEMTTSGMVRMRNDNQLHHTASSLLRLLLSFRMLSHFVHSYFCTTDALVGRRELPAAIRPQTQADVEGTVRILRGK